MPFKFNTDGSIAMKGKLPVFVDAKGNESAFDPDANAARVEALSKRVIRAAFDSSPFVKTLKMPVDIVASLFAERYTMSEDGAVVAADEAGNRLLSSRNFVDAAEFDDALQQLVDRSRFREWIVNGKHAVTPAPAPASAPAFSGSGGKVLTRAGLEALPAKERMQFFKDGGRLANDDGSAPTQDGPIAPAPGSRIARAAFDAMPPGMRAKAITVDRCTIID